MNQSKRHDSVNERDRRLGGSKLCIFRPQVAVEVRPCTWCMTYVQYAVWWVWYVHGVGSGISGCPWWVIVKLSLEHSAQPQRDGKESPCGRSKSTKDSLNQLRTLCRAEYKDVAWWHEDGLHSCLTYGRKSTRTKGITHEAFIQRAQRKHQATAVADALVWAKLSLYKST